VLSASAASAHDEHTVLSDQLGTVEFAVACNVEAQEGFTRAMALFHSFAWSQAGEAFDEVAAADPDCGMAHWGRGIVLLDNPFLWPGSLTSERLDALAAFVRERDTRDHRARLQDFEDAMGEVAEANPDDMEARVLHALLISASFDATDRTYAKQWEAAGILEELFAEHPEHPGVAHYLIHIYDYPALAEQGLDAAHRYAEIAPDAPHALHMPSHIFTRVSAWQASIESNAASAEADGHASYNTHNGFDYKVYAHLQLAQDRARASSAGTTRRRGARRRGRSRRRGGRRRSGPRRQSQGGSRRSPRRCRPSCPRGGGQGAGRWRDRNAPPGRACAPAPCGAPAPDHRSWRSSAATP
jgi:hypothetical protein